MFTHGGKIETCSLSSGRGPRILQPRCLFLLPQESKFLLIGYPRTKATIRIRCVLWTCLAGDAVVKQKHTNNLGFCKDLIHILIQLNTVSAIYLIIHPNSMWGILLGFSLYKQNLKLIWDKSLRKQSITTFIARETDSGED